MVFTASGFAKGGEEAQSSTVDVYGLEHLKERNRRTFEGRSVLPPQVLRFIKDEMALRVKATGRDVHLVFYD